MAKKNNKYLDEGFAENTEMETGAEAAGETDTAEISTVDTVSAFMLSMEGADNSGDETPDKDDKSMQDTVSLESQNPVEQAEEQSPGDSGELTDAVSDEAAETAPEIRFLETVEDDIAASDAEVMGSAFNVAAGSANIPASEAPASESVEAAPEETAEKPESPRKNSRSAFDQLDIRKLDRGLSTSQRQEWEKIYASYRAKSILSGNVVGVDRNRFAITGEDGSTEEKIVYTPVVIDYRVKVLIPETELWMPGEERSEYVVRNLMGTKIDYVITNIDREGEVAIASRRLALNKRRRMLSMMRTGNRPGDHIKCTVLSVGQRRCLVECGGFDLILSQLDLSYPYIQDLRDSYHTGMELEAVIKEYSPGEHKLVIPVREVNPNPMEGAGKRHPEGCRRIATIGSKYKGGIFCKLEDGLTCLALYSNDQLDTDFLVGDRVGVHIARINLDHGLFYGRIVAKMQV